MDSSRLRGADGEALQHGLMVACFADTRSWLGRRRDRDRPDDIPLWQAALLGCGVVTGFGAVTNAARVRIGDSVCVIGCGGVGLQVIAAARLAGAARIIAVDRRRREARARAAPRRNACGRRRRARRRRRRCAAISGGGVDHAFEVVGSGPTIRMAWDVAPRRVAPPSSSASRRVGVEVSLPAIEFLSEKSIVGSYYGSSDPAPTPAGAAGARPLGPAGPGRRGLAPDRAGRGARRVRAACAAARAIVRSSIIDPELAGAAAGGTG